ncbi:DNA mismatch repair protein MutS [Fulvivirga sp. 29W222]|uniref:DNA mismatch repair protein MutS n=1 Tax=Fulvivirga marina TaxID=2494733 RepID=A0A937KDK3_9BACT|nr:DNA mismatch repair protein MutS [Fulvivirga marina]MBL6446150.1 DNA mismatch repair protein MutS [Fulvivirga marina]
MDSTNIFNERKALFEQSFIALNRRYNSIAALRITLFIMAIVLIVVFANIRDGLGIGVTVIVFPIIFGLIVKKHNKIAEHRDLARFSALINQQETDRLANRMTELDQGNQFKNKKHPYLHDLDIFGHNSIYQLISRAVTPSGQSLVAEWLSKPAHKQEIVLRQEAVKEMIPMLDWRQAFQASGMQHGQEENKFHSLLQWINEPNRVLDMVLYKALAYILPVITITLIILNIYVGLSIYFTIGLLAINGIILKKFAEYVENITDKTFKSLKTLLAYGRMIKIIETADFKSERLKFLQSVFVHEDHNASDSILKLQKILDYLQARSNMFYLFFNFGLLFDLHLVFKAEKWKEQQKADVNQWFDHIGELEAINSLAGFAYANPEYVMPDISETDYVFETTEMGHPLIPKTERISNTISMQGKGTVNIITGSNMSGKSTFLRTVGINIAIALAGGPVCAKNFTVSRLQVFTSMRTEDNLEEHVSSFYAELRRIRMLLDMLEKDDVPVLYMLDEILKGTNSKDRHAGAAALIRQISDTNSMGFVSTHDLELGQLTDELPNLKNYSFNSIVEGDEIIFNYTLEEGICHSFNASKLMEKIGIKM